MIDLEGDINAVQPQWPEAADVLAEVTQHRQQYQTALEGRRAPHLAPRPMLPGRTRAPAAPREFPLDPPGGAQPALRCWARQAAGVTPWWRRNRRTKWLGSA